MSKYWKKVVENLKREKLLAISNLLVMTVTFTFFGVLIYVVAFSQSVLRTSEKQAQVTVFFKDEVTVDMITQIKVGLEQDKRIGSVKYISKEDAYNTFKELNKDEPLILESLTPGILPASLEIRAVSISSLSSIANDLSQKDGVEEVKFFESVIERFKVVSFVVYMVGFTLVFLFLLISYFIVFASLRTLINSKGGELEILKLVGATNSYVRNPLILQGVFFGLVSSVTSSVLVIVLGVLLEKFNMPPGGFSLGFVPLTISPVVFSIALSGVLIVSGLALGYIGSVLAVKRYLRF